MGHGEWGWSYMLGDVKIEVLAHSLCYELVFNITGQYFLSGLNFTVYFRLCVLNFIVLWRNSQTWVFVCVCVGGGYLMVPP